MRKIFENVVYYGLSIINFLVPKNSKMIVVYGRSRLNDNSEALLDYLICNHYAKKYRIFLILRQDVLNAFVGKIPIITSSFKSVLYILRAKYIFHAQGLSICKHAPGRQIIFNLWHGSPLKKIGYAANQGEPGRGNSYFLCASPFFADIIKKSFNLKDKQIFIGSNPRNDSLFHPVYIRDIWGWHTYKKIVLFMPTFHNSKQLNLSNEGGKDFPILTSENIGKIDLTLSELNVLLIIKPHPYQDNIDFLKNQFANIKILYNEDLLEKGVKLYEFLGASDALLTDFSSVYFDYLLVDKPIGFTISDINQYRKGRGFAVDTPTSLLPGHIINDENDLFHFMRDIIKGEDKYKDERLKINGIANTFKGSDACKRIVDFVIK